MVLNFGVHHCGDHPQCVTDPIPEVTAALLPVHHVVVHADGNAPTCQASASKTSGLSPRIDRTATGWFRWSSSPPR